MDKKPFQIKLTEAERERLERHRAALGLRSQADVIRTWVARPVEMADRMTADPALGGEQ